VAVIKISAATPIVEARRSLAHQAGQWVLAIGSPFGFENSATAGIISATSRSVPGENYVPFIPDRRGGESRQLGRAAVHMAGEVIGINSQIFSRTGGFMGVSFAIPIDVARNVRGAAHQDRPRGPRRIGVTIQDVNAQLAESFRTRAPHGALVSSVEKDGPAAHAGITAGDVILGVGGRAIERLWRALRCHRRDAAGSDASLAVWRNGREQSINVKVAN